MHEKQKSGFMRVKMGLLFADRFLPADESRSCQDRKNGRLSVVSTTLCRQKLTGIHKGSGTRVPENSTLFVDILPRDSAGRF